MVTPKILSPSWCKALANSPTWKLVPADSFIKHTDSTENSLTAGLLHNDHAIRAVDNYVKTDGPNGNILRDHNAEVCLVVDLGHGVDGLPNICHGGLIALLIDETAGMLSSWIWNRYTLATGELTTVYKKHLWTPKTVLFRAWVGKGGLSGRKVRINISVEDGTGLVYATGHTIFVKLKAKV